MPASRTINRHAGALLGTAVGDAVGLPAEGLRPETIRRRWKGVWRHRLVFGHGLVSDDTEHTVLVALCLMEHPDDPAAFQRALARRLRWWLVSLPAGTGLATARAILKLWVGIPPHRSGVASAGNGPLMRSAIIGVQFANDADRRHAFVEASTIITHTDERAKIAALAIAEIAAAIARQDPLLDCDFTTLLRPLSIDPRWTAQLAELRAALVAGKTVAEFATILGLARGVTGHAWHTGPMALYAWARHRGDFRAALTAILDCGGDTDTTGAIVGALAGTELGVAAIPAEWLDGIAEWPRSVTWMQRTALAIDERSPGRPATPPPYFWPALLPRNLVLLAIALTHGFARLLLR